MKHFPLEKKDETLEKCSVASAGMQRVNEYFPASLLLLLSRVASLFLFYHSELLFFSICSHVRLKLNLSPSQVIVFSRKSQENLLGIKLVNMSIMPWKLHVYGTTMFII